MKKLNILAFTNDTASYKWRFTGVARNLHQHTKSEMFITSHKSWNGNTSGADIVILEMLTAPHIVDQCQALGAKVIYEADDALLDSYGKERKNLQHLGPNFRKRAIETIEKVDAITVTNKHLAKNYKRFAKCPIYVLPNYIDFNWYGKEALRIPRVTDEIRLGWFGSRGHLEDLKMVTPAIKKVLAKYSQLKFIYCGFGGMSSEKDSTEIGWGEDAFKTIPRERREFVIAVEEEYWPTKHRMLDIDIGIAPLIDDYFNKCKTPIKWMEYATLVTPSVCSPTVYKEAVTHGKDGFIAKDVKEWVKYLTMLIEDVKLRKKIAKAAKREVERNWDIDKNWRKFVEVYQKVVI